MNDLIERLVNAIIRQEGESPENTNPGNLRDAPWFPSGAPGKRFYPGSESPEKLQYANGFWIPRSRAEGIAGTAHVVSLHIAKGESLRQLISIWAPPTDHNDTESYIRNVKGWAKIPDENLPLWNFLQSSANSFPTT